MVRFSLLSPHSVEREVNGETLRFYPISVFTMGRLREPLSKIAGSLSVLLSGGKQDAGHVVEDFIDGEMGGKRFVQQPINPELARMRSEQRATAVREAIETLLADKYRPVIAELIFSSLRDEDFPRKPSAKELDAFMDEVDTPTLIALLSGVAAGNVKVFEGSLGNVQQLVAARVREALSADEQQEMDGMPSSTPSSDS